MVSGADDWFNLILLLIMHISCMLMVMLLISYSCHTCTFQTPGGADGWNPSINQTMGSLCFLQANFMVMLRKIRVSVALLFFMLQIIDTGLFEFVVSSVLHYFMHWIACQGRGYFLWCHSLCSTELQACNTIWYLLCFKTLQNHVFCKAPLPWYRLNLVPFLSNLVLCRGWGR